MRQWSLLACLALSGCHAVTGVGDYEVAEIVGRWWSAASFDDIHARLEARADQTGIATYPVDGIVPAPVEI